MKIAIPALIDSTGPEAPEARATSAIRVVISSSTWR